MPINDRDTARLEHMLLATEEALSFVKKKSVNRAAADRVLILALTKEIEIIGEAASQISEKTRAKYQEIPWAFIISTRNRLIHGYFDIDHEVVWNTVKDDLPHLKKALRKILKDLT